MRGLLGIHVPGSAIRSILARRNADEGSLLSDIEQKEAELLEADLYIWYCKTPSIGQSTEDADGHWKHKEGSYSLTPHDKSMMLKLANGIYSKYGEKAVAMGSKVRLINL
jgi:hypothetical protein